MSAACATCRSARGIRGSYFRGRDQEALRGFLTALGLTRCAAVEAVAVDRWKPYAAELRVHGPQAALWYDLFHIVATYGLEVIDRVRVDATNRLAAAAGPGRTRDARRVINGARWLLLRHAAHLRTPAERGRLRELLRANRALFIGYVRKDDWKRRWPYRSPRGASGGRGNDAPPAVAFRRGPVAPRCANGILMGS